MFVDAASLAIAYLSPLLTPGLDAHGSVPNERPARFVRVWRTGGAAVNRVLDSPILTFQAWGIDEPDAWEIANRARDYMFAGYTAMPLVRGVEEVSGPYYDPDPDSDSERVTFSHRLRVRAKF